MADASGSLTKPFVEHIRELKRRVLWCLIALLIGSTVGYQYSQQILRVIQKPLGQTLFYTSPAGGFSFIIKLSLFFGIVVSLPFFIYQAAQFLRPLMKDLKRRTLLAYMVWSLLLAGAGILFAYTVSLPAALHFLTNFGGENIQSLITADSYFNFAMTYIGGFALLFQIPLILLFVNRVTPLKPSKLMKGQRYVILGSFILAALLTPTPDPFNQLIMALPIIVLYQIGVAVVWMVNSSKSKKRPRQIVHPVSTKAVPKSSQSSTVQPAIRPKPRPQAHKIVDIVPPPPKAPV